MKKFAIALAAVGALTLSMAGVSSAAVPNPLDLNLYGASAQYNFWSVEAASWLEASVANGGAGCAAANVTTKSFTPSDGTPSGVYYHGSKYFIATGTGCGLNHGTVNIRVGTYDSADGIQAVIGNTNVIDVNGCLGNQRTQLISTANTNLGCFSTTLGASDVDGLSVVETTTGQLDGPKGPAAGTTITGSDGQSYDLGNWTAPANAYGAAGYTPVDTVSANSAVNDYHPLIVPFAFFANTSLQSGLTNLTTAQVQEIFNGVVTDWKQFGFSSSPVVLCMRVAGSGTYATFDNGVTSTNGTTNGLPTFDSSPLNGGITAGAATVWLTTTCPAT